MHNNIATTWSDYPDNESLAVIIYINGCTHFCKDCQNKEFQVFDEKRDIFSLEDYIKLKKTCYYNNTNKIVLSGGDPLYTIIEKKDHKVQDKINYLFEMNYDICIYTGYDIGQVKENNVRNFKYIKCGKYMPELKQLSEKTDEYLQFSSSNQKLYDSNFNLLSNNGRYYFKENN